MSEAERDALRDCLGEYSHPRWYLVCRCGRPDEDEGEQDQEEMPAMAEQDGRRVVDDEACCPGCAAAVPARIGSLNVAERRSQTHERPA